MHEDPLCCQSGVWLKCMKWRLDLAVAIPGRLSQLQASCELTTVRAAAAAAPVPTQEAGVTEAQQHAIM